jgi:hypothetical protein
MKLHAVTLILSLATGAAFSQSLLNRAQSAATSPSVSAPALPSLSNITGAKDAIMGKLSPALNLTPAQKPIVSTNITGFLKDKAAIQPLATTDKAAYTSKFSALQGGTFSKLKTALTAAQYAKLLGLKPAVPSATNVLSNLFY